MLSERMKQGLEQMGKAIGGIPDYVPVVAQAGAHTMLTAKVNVRDFLSNPDLFIKAHLLVSDYYQFDAPSLTYDLYNIEAEALGQDLVWIEGQLPEIDASNHIIKRPSDLDKLRPPNPRRDGRMPFVIEFNNRCVDLGFNPNPRFCAPFTLAANLRGLSNLVMDTLMHPDFAHKLLHFVTYEVLAPYLQALQEECGRHLTCVGADALASLPITNLNIIKEYALGYTLELMRLVDKVEVRAWWGERLLDRPEDLMELKLQAQPSLLVVFDPDVYEVGPALIKEFAIENDVLLILGLDVSLVKEGDLEELTRRVEDYVTTGGQGGRFILFLNDVAPECPAQRVHYTVQAGKFFGRREYIEGQKDEKFQFKPRECFEEWLFNR